MATIDRDLVNFDAALAAKVTPIPELAVRLVYIDAEAGEDKYCILQLLEDTTLRVASNEMRYYSYLRYGGTGTRGQIELNGPVSRREAGTRIAAVFQEKTGVAWGTLALGERTPPGKYWPQQESTPEAKAQWQYYVSDNVDGKSAAWYPYAESASNEVEELYAQHVANERENRTAERVIFGGYFKYKVNLENMTQENTKTSKVRTIRRAVTDEVQTHDSSPRRGLKRSAPSDACFVPMRKMPMRKSPMRTVSTCSVNHSMKAMRVMKKRGEMKGMKVVGRKGMKSMKKMRAMKAMKKVKVKKARKHEVFSGKRRKTAGGLKKDDLVKNNVGKVVSKRRSESGKATFRKNLMRWVEACSKARVELGIKGFSAVKKGTPFYARTRQLYDA